MHSEGLGMWFRYISDGPNFEVFSLTWHYHGDDTDTCEFRNGLQITIMNAQLSIGWFRI